MPLACVNANLPPKSLKVSLKKDLQRLKQGKTAKFSENVSVKEYTETKIGKNGKIL